MATITQILGTDSLSSSRIVLNDNFTAINDQLEDVTGLLDVDTQTITLTGGVNASSISLAAGGTNRFIVNASGITLGLETTVEGILILDGGLRHSVTLSALTEMPGAQSYSLTTYVIDGTATAIAAGANVVEAGVEGQEITLIAESDAIAIDIANITGPTALTINQNGTLTLRWHAGAWYIISSFNCAITV
jgi:hypothetical protein